MIIPQERLDQIEAEARAAFTVDVVNRPLEGKKGLYALESFWASIVRTSDPKRPTIGAELRGQLACIRDEIVSREAALPPCRHCNKPVAGGGSEHEECRINEREMWGPSGRPDVRY